MPGRILRRLQHLFAAAAQSGPRELALACLRFRGPASVLGVYLGLRALREPRWFAARDGSRMLLASLDELQVAWALWIRGEYPVSGGEALIVDAGANFGAFSLYAAARCPGARIFAFEPAQGAYRALEANIAANGLADRIKPHRLGVAGAGGRRQLFPGKQSPYSSMYQDPGGGEPQAIDTLGLAELLRAIGDPPAVDLLKMDCEGAEMECLLAASADTLARFRRVHIEFHAFSGHSLDGLNRHLRAAGFTVVRCDPEGRGIGMAVYQRAG